MQRILDLLSASSKEKLAATELARFDLEQPALSVKIDGQTFAFGTNNPLTQDQYLATGDGVYMVSSYYASLIPATAERMLAHSLFTQNETPVGFTFKALRVQQKDGKWILEPAPAAEAERPSQDDLNRWADDWRYASSLITQPWHAKPAAETVQVQADRWQDRRLAYRAKGAGAHPRTAGRKAAVPFLGRDEPPPAPADGKGGRPCRSFLKSRPRGSAWRRTCRASASSRQWYAIASLRWPVPPRLPQLVAGRRIQRLERRSKYLLLDCSGGWLILHLGMSGSLRVVPADTPPGIHDHVDLVLEDAHALRLRDPRRFGAVLWEPGDPTLHKLLRSLAPEPLEPAFTADWLYERMRGRSAPIKSLLMDSSLVCGVGNIYANESLFRAGIHPIRTGGRISRARYGKLVQEIRNTLTAAIHAGGSSLRDFVHVDGSPGYFQQHYFVYGRHGEHCLRCSGTIRALRIGQRSTFYCPHCQK